MQNFFIIIKVGILRGGRNLEFHYYDRPFFQNVNIVFLVHHYYDKNQTFDVLILRMASKKIRTSKIEISTTYGVLPMVTKACGGLG